MAICLNFFFGLILNCPLPISFLKNVGWLFVKTTFAQNNSLSVNQFVENRRDSLPEKPDQTMAKQNMARLYYNGAHRKRVSLYAKWSLEARKVNAIHTAFRPRSSQKVKMSTARRWIE